MADISTLRARLTAALARTSQVMRSNPRWASMRRSAFEALRTLVVAFLLAQLIMVSVAQAFQVEQYSMEPTLLPHDRVLVSKFIYRFREPHRGDVVVLRYPRNPARNYIKRVVGLSGEKIRIKDGKVFVNGQPMPETYINGHAMGDYGPFSVPADHVFVLGDNRNNSEDSRAFGPVKRELVVGQAIIVYWPFQRAKLLITR